jgi:hypothetical protein
MSGRHIDPGSLPRRYQDQIARSMMDEEKSRAHPLESKITQPKRRLRQSQKPLLNKLETQFWAHLCAAYPPNTIHCQAKRYELARGIWYKPDFVVTYAGQEIAYEVKGPKVFRGGFENLKVAARVWPEVRFVLTWKAEKAWGFQAILP